MTVWGTQDIKEGKIYYYKAGSRIVLVKKKDDEWSFLELPLPENSAAVTTGIYEKGVELTSPWTSVMGEKSSVLRCVPAFPELPVVIKPSQPFKILPRKEVLMYVQVPLYMQFLTSIHKSEELLFEASSIDYSVTWFGDPDKGMLGYSLPLNLSSTLEMPSNVAHSIICPLRLVNASKGVLDIQRLLIQVNYLQIYLSQENLWSNEVRIEFKGEMEVSDVSYGKNQPEFLKESIQLASSRELKPNIFAKSFYFIKALNNI